MRRIAMVAAVIAMVAAPTSARADFFGGVGTYFKDRGHDLLDVLRLRGGIPEEGKAIGVKARVTSLAQVGYVQFRGKMYGMERRAIGVTAERTVEGGLSLLYASSNEMRPVAGNSFVDGDTIWSEIEERRIVRNLPYWDDGRRRFFSVGAEVATPLLALDAGVYPEEALDFVLGWVGVDIYDDDELFLRSEGELPEPTTPRRPDLLAPFRAKRMALQEFDERMKVEQALSDEPLPLETAERPAPPHLPQEVDAEPREVPHTPVVPAPDPEATPAPAAAKELPGIGAPPPPPQGSIEEDDADRAVEAIEGL